MKMSFRAGGSQYRLRVDYGRDHPKMTNALSQILTDVRRYLVGEEPWRLMLRLTALLFLLYPIGHEFQYLLKFAALLLLLFPPLLRQIWIWIAILIYMISVLTQEWYLLNNHEFLIVYWCLVCVLASREQDPAGFMAFNGRIIVGLSFLFAVLWKLFTAEFTNGSFLLNSFLVDERFFGLSSIVTGLSTDVLQNNLGLFEALKIYPVEDATIKFASGGRAKFFSYVFSYWTLLIESLLIVGFLSRRPAFLHRHRHIPLLIFIATTYHFVLLPRFAMILTTMGFAQCPAERVNYRIAYLLLAALIPIL